MYKRCISDNLDLEPRQLYNLVTFLMYDKDFRGRVTIEETLQILFVRHGRKNLDEEIKAIFGEEERNKDNSEEQSITYSEYVSKITRRALNKQAAYLGKKKGRNTGEDDMPWDELTKHPLWADRFDWVASRVLNLDTFCNSIENFRDGHYELRLIYKPDTTVWETKSSQ